MDEERFLGSFYDATLGLCAKIKSVIEKIPKEIKCEAQEIRLRVNKNILVNTYNQSFFLTHDGMVSTDTTLLFASPVDIDETFKNICDYSLYSYQNQIKNGYITFRGGHRAGICGTAIVQGDSIINIKNISSINIRIAKEVKNSADEILRVLDENLDGMLIVGPPSSGKTTLLRDLSRSLSKIVLKKNNKKQKHIKVTIVDERGEIGAVHQGLPQCDIGLCDILDGYPKGIGILQAIRVLSPDVIICDEVGSESDVKSIEESLNAGVSVICSIHASSVQELLRKKQAKRLIETGAFNKIVFLENQNNPGKIKEVIEVGDLCV